MRSELVNTRINDLELQLIEDVCKAFSDCAVITIACKLQYILNKELTAPYYVCIGYFIGRMEQPNLIVPISLN